MIMSACTIQRLEPARSAESRLGNQFYRTTLLASYRLLIGGTSVVPSVEPKGKVGWKSLSLQPVYVTPIPMRSSLFGQHRLGYNDEAYGDYRDLHMLQAPLSSSFYCYSRVLLPLIIATRGTWDSDSKTTIEIARFGPAVDSRC